MPLSNDHCLRMQSAESHSSLALQCDAALYHLESLLSNSSVVQALVGPPSQDSIEDNTGYSYDYLLGMPIQSLTVEKVRIDCHACRLLRFRLECTLFDHFLDVCILQLSIPKIICHGQRAQHPTFLQPRMPLFWCMNADMSRRSGPL